MTEEIRFIASLPQIQSAIKIGQDSARIQFDVPASHLAEALRLVTLMGKTFIVTIEEEALHEFNADDIGMTD